MGVHYILYINDIILIFFFCLPTNLFVFLFFLFIYVDEVLFGNIIWFDYLFVIHVAMK